MTITRIGATKQYASNWAQAFDKKEAVGKTAAKTPSSPKKKGSTTKRKASRKGAK